MLKFEESGEIVDFINYFLKKVWKPRIIILIHLKICSI